MFIKVHNEGEKVCLCNLNLASKIVVEPCKDGATVDMYFENKTIHLTPTVKKDIADAFIDILIDKLDAQEGYIDVDQILEEAKHVQWIS